MPADELHVTFAVDRADDTSFLPEDWAVTVTADRPARVRWHQPDGTGTTTRFAKNTPVTVPAVTAPNLLAAARCTGHRVVDGPEWRRIRNRLMDTVLVTVDPNRPGQLTIRTPIAHRNAVDHTPGKLPSRPAGPARAPRWARTTAELPVADTPSDLRTARGLVAAGAHVTRQAAALLAVTVNDPATAATVDHELRRYQRRAVLAGTSGPGMLNTAGVGLGKTVMTVAALDAAAATRPVTALAVVPTAVVGQWAAEAARFAPRLRATIAPDLTGDLVVTTPARFRDMDITARAWTHLVIDEGNWVTRPSKQARAARTARAHIPHATVLTGTPPTDAETLTELAAFTLATPALAADTPEALAAAMGPWWFTTARADVADELPAVTIDLTPVPGSNDPTALVNQLAGVLRDLHGGTTRDPAAKARAAAARVHLHARVRDVIADPASDQRRHAWIIDRVTTASVPSVVFLDTPDAAETLAKTFDAEGHAVAVLDGSVPAATRTRIVADFAAGTVTTVIVTAAASTGVNLQIAELVIFADVPWDADTWIQRIGRASRIGGADAVTVAIPVTPREPDAIVAAALHPVVCQRLAGDTTTQPPTVTDLASLVTGEPA